MTATLSRADRTVAPRMAGRPWYGSSSSRSCRGPHRADIFNGRTVVELQHSSISGTRTLQRVEAFYGDMVWLFDATTPLLPT